MKQLTRYLADFAAFLRREEGSALPLIGLGLFVLMGSTAIAIDMGRVQIAQARMTNSLDAAGLAAGSVISTTNLTTEVNKYFYANFPTGYMGTTITTLTATANSDNSVITLNAAGTVNTTFMKIFGLNTVAIKATSQVTRASKGMELILVMDNTGSMSDPAGGSVSKIQAAKTAATTLLNDLYGGAPSISNLWVGLVPFAQAVNIGTQHTAWLDTTYDATLKWGTTTWGGCVEARSNGVATPQYDITDDPPSVKLFRQYNYPCNTSTYADKWYGTNSSHDNCTTGTGLQYKTGLNSTSLGPNYYCSQSLLGMVAEEQTVLNAINTMQPLGATHIDLGLAWAWRMLSPRWRGIWGGEMDINNLPQDYNTPLMNKVVVLMTDGDNTVYGTNAAVSASYPGVYTAYGFPSSSQLGSSECTSGANCTTGENQMNTRTTTLCNNMKAQGILIYTIALGTDVSATGQNLLQACATSPDYYFLSPTTDSLQTAFQQIGDSLANLRISQ